MYLHWAHLHTYSRPGWYLPGLISRWAFRRKRYSLQLPGGLHAGSRGLQFNAQAPPHPPTPPCVTQQPSPYSNSSLSASQLTPPDRPFNHSAIQSSSSKVCPTCPFSLTWPVITANDWALEPLESGRKISKFAHMTMPKCSPRHPVSQ